MKGFEMLGTGGGAFAGISEPRLLETKIDQLRQFLAHEDTAGANGGFAIAQVANFSGATFAGDEGFAAGKLTHVEAGATEFGHALGEGVHFGLFASEEHDR